MSQRQDILQHMCDTGSIDPKTALEHYGCMRLASRIDELRNMGVRIKTTMKKLGPRRVASYSLSSEDNLVT